MHDVAMRRRLAALLIAAALAVLLLGVAALLWTQQAQAQEPCNTNFCVDKTVDQSTVTVGEQITFTITERCFEDVGCSTKFPLVDQLPSGLTIDSVEYTGVILNPETGVPDPSIKCTRSGNTVTCPGPRLITPTSPFTLTIVATTTECGTFTNTAGTAGGPAFEGSVTYTVNCLPTTKEQCKKGGWEDFGYPDQGTCVSDVNRRNR